MVAASQINPGATISLNKKLYKVESAVKVTVAKGTPFIKTKLRDVSGDKLIEKNFKLDDELDEVSLEERVLEFLYPEGKSYLFYDFNNIEHLLVPSQIIGDRVVFLKEGVEVSASLYGDTVFAVELPQFLELMVSEIEGEEELGPLSKSPKIAIIETGAKVEVPSFVEVGDIIKVDTKTQEYIQRV